MYEFIREHVKVPEKFKGDTVSSVYVWVTVDTLGRFKDVSVKKPGNELLDAEAIRVVKEMPLWNPAQKNGVAVEATAQVRVSFGRPQNIFDTKPEYPGGMAAFKDYIVSNVKYPEQCKKDTVEGRVYVKFVIGKDGKLGNVEIARGVHELLDAEAVRVISNSPDWKPALKNNEPVEVPYTVPVNFSLSDKKKAADEKPVFFIVEQMPEFPGGKKGLDSYIQSNTKYPDEAVKNKIQGRVFITFIVNDEGKVTDARIAKGVDPLLDAEALKVIESMPEWKPGYQRGVAVNVSFTVPVNFAL